MSACPTFTEEQRAKARPWAYFGLAGMVFQTLSYLLMLGYAILIEPLGFRTLTLWFLGTALAGRIPMRITAYQMDRIAGKAPPLNLAFWLKQLLTPALIVVAGIVMWVMAPS